MFGIRRVSHQSDKGDPKGGSIYAYVTSLLPEYEAVIDRIPITANGGPALQSESEAPGRRPVLPPHDLMEVKKLTWAQVAELEALIVGCMDAQQLRLKAIRLRELYQDLMACAPAIQTSEQSQAQAQAATPPDSSTLRSEVLELLSQFHFQLGVKRRREQLRSLLTTWLGGALVIVVAALVVTLLLALNLPTESQSGATSVPNPQSSSLTASVAPVILVQHQPSPGADDPTPATGPRSQPGGDEGSPQKQPAAGGSDTSTTLSRPLDNRMLLLLSLLAGLCGGLVSVIRRVQMRINQDCRFACLIELEHNWISVLGVPLLGAIFAGLLYFMLAGRVLQGEIFPEFVKASIDDSHVRGQEFMNFFKLFRVASNEDVAKLLFWSFLAGFSEQLVPDALERMTAQAKKP